MAKPRNRPQQAPARSRNGSNLNVWINDRLYEAFEALRKRTRRDKTTEITVILEDYLQRQGLWSPDPTD